MALSYSFDVHFSNGLPFRVGGQRVSVREWSPLGYRAGCLQVGSGPPQMPKAWHSPDIGRPQWACL